MTLIELFGHGVLWAIGITVFLLLTGFLVLLPPTLSVFSFMEAEIGAGLGLLLLTVATWFLYILILAGASTDLDIGPWWIRLPQ